MLLELKGVTVYYGTAMAVTDISLSQEEGSVVSVIGANGAGKSTILKAINGLVPLRSGTIEFDGKRIDGSRTDAIVKAGIACVPESRKLFPYMSVQSNLNMGAYSAQGQAGGQGGSGRRLRPLSPAERETATEGGESQRRRAADAGHRPRADVQAQAADDG